MKPIGISILGGTGYGAGELLRLLVHHPYAEVVQVTSASESGAPVAAVHTHLSREHSGRFTRELDLQLLASYEHKVIFAALPHGTSREMVSRLFHDPGLEDAVVIDLSGDFRLQDPLERERHYPGPVDESIRSRFVYGLPEIDRDKLRGARAISNPGCLASACILALRPFVDLLDEGSAVVLDAKTGTSGAGRSATETTHHATRHGNLIAYKILEHRHEPEIRQGLGRSGMTTMFVPHLLPIARGIFASVYGTLANDSTTAELTELLRRFYEPHPFIRVREGTPDLHAVLGSNYCDVSVTVRGRQIVAMSVLDNLVKGMAGQAIQNMNLACGFDESAGLRIAGMGPY